MRDDALLHANETGAVFVKVSGDLFLSENFLAWVYQEQLTHKVVIGLGGGAQINEAFYEQGLPFRKHAVLGRETSQKGLRLAHKVLKKNKARLKEALRAMGATNVTIMLPVLPMGEDRWHVDADLLVFCAYWAYEHLYVVTTSERVNQKRDAFLDPLDKIRFLTF
jgi:hypothetical protein